MTSKRKKRTGSRAGRLVRLALFATAVVLLSGFFNPPARAGKDKKDKKEPERYAVIAGTVFRDSGLSLRGAEVIVEPAPGSESGHKPKKLEAVSDGRGEFSVRVPAEPMRYTVSVKAKGYRPAEKTVSIQADERVDVFFLLKPDAGKASEVSK